MVKWIKNINYIYIVIIYINIKINTTTKTKYYPIKIKRLMSFTKNELVRKTWVWFLDGTILCSTLFTFRSYSELLRLISLETPRVNNNKEETYPINEIDYIYPIIWSIKYHIYIQLANFNNKKIKRFLIISRSFF